MKIAKALPHIFDRTYPVLESRTNLLIAVRLLRFHQIDAIPIEFQKKQKKQLAVLGYSCLSYFLKADPSRYNSFLNQPCENAAQELASISSDADIEELLRLFQKTKFGFAMVEGKYELGALVSLRDLLELYKKGIMKTTLSLEKVASPIFSMSSKSTLRQVLNEMFERRFRRIFLDNKKQEQVVTDRRIISYIFSVARLYQVAHGSSNLLDAPVNELEPMQPLRLPDTTKLKVASDIMKEQIEQCLTCDKGVITPWDMIMKPWNMRKLDLL